NAAGAAHAPTPVAPLWRNDVQEVQAALAAVESQARRRPPAKMVPVLASPVPFAVRRGAARRVRAPAPLRRRRPPPPRQLVGQAPRRALPRRRPGAGGQPAG